MFRERSITQTNGAASITEGLMQRRRELLGIRLDDFSREAKEAHRAMIALVDRIVMLRRRQITGIARPAVGAEFSTEQQVGIGSSRNHLHSLPLEAETNMSLVELGGIIPDFLSSSTKMIMGLAELGRPEEALGAMRQTTGRYLSMGYRVSEIFTTLPALHESLMEALNAINSELMRMASSGNPDSAIAITRKVVRTLNALASRIDIKNDPLVELELSLRHSSTQFALEIGDMDAARRTLHSGLQKYHAQSMSLAEAGETKKAAAMRAAEHKMLDLSIALEGHISSEIVENRSKNLMDLLASNLNSIALALPELRRLIDESSPSSEKDRHYPGTGQYL